MKFPVSIDTSSRESLQILTTLGAAASGIAVALLVLVLRGAGVVEVLDLGLYDRGLRLGRPVASEARRLVLVRISESDIQGMGSWPIADDLLARLLESVAVHEPSAIGIDIFRDQPVGSGRDLLRGVFERHPNIVGVHFVAPAPGTPGVRPPEFLLDHPARSGFANVVVDAGGIVRRGLLLMGGPAGDVDQSFALRIALVDLARDGIVAQSDPGNRDHMRLGQGTIRQFRADDGGYVDADAGEYQFLIDYRDDADAFDVIDMWSVLSGDIESERLRERIVLIGVTASSVKDEFYTPLGSGSDGTAMQGIELQARMIGQLLRAARLGHEPPRSIANGWEIAIVILASLAGALVGVRIGVSGTFALIWVLGPVALSALTLGMLQLGTWIPTASGSLGWLVSAAAGLVIDATVEHRQRSRIYELFSRFCSPEVVEEIWRHRDDVLSPGRSTSLSATVMFTDIVDFSRIAEQLGPHRLMTWLNTYTCTMMPLVFGHGGIVIRLVGDAFMIAFGAPCPRLDAQAVATDAKNAVRCAIAMRHALQALNAACPRDVERIAIRIGIASGPVVAGVLGDRQRQEYNLHGDCVNTAARVEQYEKGAFEPDLLRNPARILLTGATNRLLDGEFSTRLFAESRLRGMEQTTRIFIVD